MEKMTHVGFVWYTRDDYPAARALMVDGEKLPKTFDDFERLATKGFTQSAQQGHIPIKAHIQSAHFAAWCRQRGIDANADARLSFANEAALDAHRKRSQG